MTPAEEAVLAAARAYRDARDAWVQSYTENHDDPDRNHLRGSVSVALGGLQQAAIDLVDAPPVEAPTVAAVRPWPDPEAYKALAREVYGQSDLTAGARDVPAAVAAWKALQDGQRVMCARGYQWAAWRYAGRLRFTMAKQDGRPGKTLEQPWYPCIVGKLPVWPIVIEAAEPVTC